MATVIVTLRRRPVTTSRTTKSVSASATHRAHAVHPARSRPGRPSPRLQFHYSPAHRVDDGVVVRGHQHRGAGSVDPLEQHHDVAAGVGVEVAGGLVREQQCRPVHERAGDGHPLLFTAGQLMRDPLGLALEADPLQHFRHVWCGDPERRADHLEAKATFPTTVRSVAAGSPGRRTDACDGGYAGRRADEVPPPRPSIVPGVATSSRISRRSKVDSPEPDGPTTNANSPLSTSTRRRRARAGPMPGTASSPRSSRITDRAAY